MVVGILNYNAGNIYNIKKTLLSLKVKVRVIKSKKDFKGCDKLILPGVGSFETAMTLMKKNKLDTKIKNLISNGQKVLGICLGMQLLFSFSEEGNSNGLDIFKGKVIHLKNLEIKKYPNIGWNKTNFSNKKMGIEDEYFYYVHNYTVVPENSSIIFANTYIEDKLLVTAVRGTDDKKNILGIQFHPEKSGKNGLNFLKIITSKILNSE